MSEAEAKKADVSPSFSALTATVPLTGGGTIPVVGLGVYRAERGKEACEAVETALKLGYRHVDTAQIYRNEEDVGTAIKNSGVPRDQIFVTTKLWVRSHNYEQAVAAIEGSLAKLQLDYVDLFLVHSPFATENRMESWRALEDAQKKGLTKYIGVSNYGKHHMEEILSKCSVRPVVNQIELSPYTQRKELVEYCVQNGVILEAYSPLTKGHKLKDAKLVEAAKRLSVTPAQLLIRWCIQKGFVVLPKSVKPDRIAENADVSFTIPEDLMTEMESWDEYLITGWDPTVDP
eukprot:TRINITY_DN2670_c0_g1_i1.p1 TRINITY_DN2670_c0_g1~~TRINITY_DN2670_c0_g1_i1.p1  ORF type:complete len:306 (+),score=91.22 TRINITY_DN2670_c0_g1_i1:54-920(+)